MRTQVGVASLLVVFGVVVVVALLLVIAYGWWGYGVGEINLPLNGNESEEVGAVRNERSGNDSLVVTAQLPNDILDPIPSFGPAPEGHVSAEGFPSEAGVFELPADASFTGRQVDQVVLTGTLVDITAPGTRARFVTKGEARGTVEATYAAGVYRLEAELQLADPPDGFVYTTWLIRPEPRSMTVFAGVLESGRQEITVNRSDLQDFSTYLVTLTPVGGEPSPYDEPVARARLLPAELQ